MLPTLSVPTFVAKIPSTGQEVKYRPFLVKEEKILLMAMEGKDRNEIRVAINEILKSCVYDEVDFDNLPTFDIEFLFLMLRAKSVGEVITFKLGHNNGECQHRTEVELNLNDIDVIGEIEDGKIMLDDNVGIKMHYPTISALDNLANDSKNVLSVIADCIEVVFDEDEVYDDFTKEEMIAWLENLNKQQYKKINDFFNSAPKLSKTIKWKCEKCGEEDEVTIEGLYNFFM